MKNNPQIENAYHRGAITSILETIALDLCVANEKIEQLVKNHPKLSPEEITYGLVDIETCKIRLEEELQYAMRHIRLIVPFQTALQEPDEETQQP